MTFEEKPIQALIDFYKDQWKLSKANADKCRLNLKIKYHRDSLLKENIRMECFSTFINNLVGLKTSKENKGNES